MKNLLYSQMKPNEQRNIVFKELLMFFLASILRFRNFKWSSELLEIFEVNFLKFYYIFRVSWHR